MTASSPAFPLPGALDPDLADLVARVASPDASVRRIALIELADLEDPDLVPAFVAALRDDPVVPGRPIVLTRVGLERPEFQAKVDDFLARAKEAGADVRVIDVPDGHHGFDALDHTDQSRDAVRAAIAAVTEKLMRRS